MAITIGVIIYLVFCLLTGLCGSQRRLGFLGTFLLSIFITPVVMLIVLQLTGPPRDREWRRRPRSD
jgi:FtsH-binding integral membrane protein